METTVDAPAGLRLLNVCRVAPAPRQMPVDNCSNVKVKLSFLDMPWVATPPVQEVFLYDEGGGAEYGAIVKRLKESLAASLALYLPFAGKLAYVQETRDIVVDCSDPGVAFFEAEAMAGCMDLSRLATDDDYDGDVPAMELASLVPEHDTRVLPAPAMVVQATRLNPGLALAVSVHHAAADGRSFDLLINAWTSMFRGGTLPVTNKPLSPPIISRDAINALPGSHELAHQVLSKVAPNLPLVANAMEADDYMSQRHRLRHRTFLLGADNIRTLKQHIDGLQRSPSGEVKKPVSTFVALSALSWAAFVRAKGLAAGEDTHLVFQVDLRARLRPPVPGYIGNCVRACIASADAGELLGDMGLLRASRAIQAAVKEAVEAPLDSIGEWMERLIALPAARQANVGGSPMFRRYQTADFGFGMPRKVVPLSMAGSPETTTCGYHGSAHVAQSMSMNDDHGGRIVLLAGKRDGEVCLSVSLDPVLMDAFKNNIYNDIPTRSRL